MLGIIVTGHGHFATGLTSSLDLIAGPQKEYVAVDFEQSDSTDDLEKKLRTAFETLKDSNGIIVFADLPGGSPFKTAAIIAREYQNVHVLGGTNLPMLCEISMARTMIEDVDSLVGMALNTGKDQVVEFTLKVEAAPDPDAGEGI